MDKIFVKKIIKFFDGVEIIPKLIFNPINSEDNFAEKLIELEGTIDRNVDLEF